MSDVELANWTMVLAAIVLIIGVWVNNKAQQILSEARKVQREAELILAEAHAQLDESMKVHSEVTLIRREVMEELDVRRLM